LLRFVHFIDAESRDLIAQMRQNLGGFGLGADLHQCAERFERGPSVLFVERSLFPCGQGLRLDDLAGRLANRGVAGIEKWPRDIERVRIVVIAEGG
jgi:hypothetical protein